jgi:protein TonB
MRFFLSVLLVMMFTAVTAQEKDSVPPPPVGEDIFTEVEVEASTDAAAWRKHLEEKLLPYLERATRKGMKPGVHTVNVRFLVEKNGSIADVKALNNPGFGLAKAAENVVKSGPKWKPGMVNGRVVRSYHTQPISFVIVQE